MRVFTIDEANSLLPDIVPKLETIRRLYVRIQEQSSSAQSAAAASQAGGGMEGGTNYVKSLYEVGKLTKDLGDLGVQIKDHTRGLIDFPSMRDGRLVLLCWHLGEGDEIEWWHEVEAGFAGRQPL